MNFLTDYLLVGKIIQCHMGGHIGDIIAGIFHCLHEATCVFRVALGGHGVRTLHMDGVADVGFACEEDLFHG